MMAMNSSSIACLRNILVRPSRTAARFRHSDIQRAMARVFAVFRLANGYCGGPAGRALLLLVAGTASICGGESKRFIHAICTGKSCETFTNLSQVLLATAERSTEATGLNAYRPASTLSARSRYGDD
jgi:hypothetical protein